MARATGRLQKSGVSSSSASVIPGPNAGTMSSMPYGPPLTLKKKMAAIGTSPSSRLRPPFRSRPLCRGDELRELLHPLLDRAGSIHDDLELAAREPAHPRSEEHTSELQSRQYLVCRLLLEKKNTKKKNRPLHKTIY